MLCQSATDTALWRDLSLGEDLGPAPSLCRLGRFAMTGVSCSSSVWPGTTPDHPAGARERAFWCSSGGPPNFPNSSWGAERARDASRKDRRPHAPPNNNATDVPGRAPSALPRAVGDLQRRRDPKDIRHHGARRQRGHRKRNTVADCTRRPDCRREPSPSGPRRWCSNAPAIKEDPLCARGISHDTGGRAAPCRAASRLALLA